MKESVIALWVNGRGMSHELTRRIMSLNFKYRRNKADSGTIVFRDPDAELFDTRIFKKGQLIHFIVGWTDEALPAGPFMVKSYKMIFPESGEPTLTVNFQDLSHKLDKKQKRRKHIGKVSDILIKIAEEHGLGYDVDSLEGLEFSDDFPLNQVSMTDAGMLQVLADRYGYSWGVENGNLIFKRPADRQIKKLGSPRVLSYRINDCSITSFSPEVKFQSLGKKKSPNSTVENLDLLSGNGVGDFISNILTGDMTEEERQELFAEHKGEADEAVLIEESIGSYLEKNVGEGFRLFYHEAVDSTERLISWVAGTGYQTTRESFGKTENQWFTEQMKRDVATHVDKNKYDDPDAEQSIYDEVWELEHSDMTLATPGSMPEAERRRKGKLAKIRELVTADLKLTRASMSYHPGETIIVAGVGGFLSGEYLIKEVSHSFQKNGMPFSTSMKVSRSRLGTSKTALKLIAKQEESIRRGIIQITGVQEEQFEPELANAGIVKKVDDA
jgi:phage protein D